VNLVDISDELRTQLDDLAFVTRAVP